MPLALDREYAAYGARLAEIPEVDIAWFGGWVSADGSIHDWSWGRPGIRVSITDLDPLERMAELFGNAPKGPYAATGLGKKPVYVWAISGWKAYQLLERVDPWLSNRYAERSRILREGWTPREHRGRKLTPENAAYIKQELVMGKWGICRKLARQFDVSEALITSIKMGRAWV